MNPILFLIAIFVIIDLFYVDKYLKKLAKENSANKFYEESELDAQIESILSKLQNIKGYKKFYVNAHVPKENGETAKIDLIMVNEKGIFVFEPQNHEGLIVGNVKSKKWTEISNSNKKHKFYNPILQNEANIKALANFLQSDSPNVYNSHIVYNGKCELNIRGQANVNSIKSDLSKPSELIENVSDFVENSPIILSHNQIMKIDLKLRETVNVNNQIRR